MTTIPTPLSPINELPEVIAAQQLRELYVQQVAAIRARSDDDIAKAHAVVDVWQKINISIAADQEDLLTRRQARVTWLESQVPWGPDVPKTASEADAAVLFQAFRTVLAQARDASDDDLHKLLTDAVAFGDGTALRAGLTALVERDGGREKARSWWLQITGSADLLDEAAQLADGYVLWKTRIQQLFAPIEAPDEIAVLQAAQIAAQAAVAAAQNTRQQRPAGFFV
jgi:hypothetical protein